jgi:hypothetical protein
MKINFLKILIAFTFFSNLAMASFEFKDIYDQPFETIARFLEGNTNNHLKIKILFLQIDLVNLLLN